MHGQQILDGPSAEAVKGDPKKKTFYDPKQKSERVQQERAAYREELPTLKVEEVIALDEMGAATNLTPLYGRSLPGERVYGAKPTAPGKRISTVGALGLSGLKTVMCFEGTLTGAVFLQFLDEFLVPVLKPGQIVILDNAKAHKVAGVRERIEGAGARVLYLPPYSPDLNPIEMAWSKVKQFLRKAQARTVEALYEAIAQALQTLSPTDAKGFFKHVGFCI